MYVLAKKKSGSVIAASESLSKVKAEKNKRGIGRIYQLKFKLNKRKGKMEVVEWASVG